MNYKKIVLSLVLVGLNSFVGAMVTPIKKPVQGILSTNEERKIVRKKYLKQAAITKHEEIQQYQAAKNFGNTSPVSVRAMDEESFPRSCVKGSRTVEAKKCNVRFEDKTFIKCFHDFMDKLDSKKERSRQILMNENLKKYCNQLCLDRLSAKSLESSIEEVD